jgi:hypothetical protein
MGGSGLAVGGVVLAVDFVSESAFAPDATSSATLYRHLQSTLPGTPLMAQPVVVDMVDPGLFAAILDDYAHLGQADVGRLGKLAVELNGPRRLALVRVEKDVLEFPSGGASVNALPGAPGAADGLARGVERSRAVLSGVAAVTYRGTRSLTATLDILDLDSGSVLWSARATVEHGFAAGRHAPPQAADLKWTKADSTHAPVTYDRHLYDMDNADDAALFERCIQALTTKLTVSTSPQRHKLPGATPDSSPLR